MKRDIVFAPEAEADLNELYAYIADKSGAERANGYINRIVTSCEGLATFPERGELRDELRPGLRVMGFERRVSIAFHVTPDRVIIDRIFYGGRDLPAAFEQDGS